MNDLNWFCDDDTDEELDAMAAITNYLLASTDADLDDLFAAVVETAA